jgi:serine/threonine protein kinase/class 3 adenylate cyclase
MTLDQYRLLAQRGAGPDGIAYRAQAADSDVPVEVRVLSGARADAERWPVLFKRLRLAALVDHDAALKLRTHELDPNPPFVVLEWLEGRTLAAELADRVPLPQPAVLSLARELASAVAAAHRLGLVHGRLCPGQIYFTPDDRLKIDFTDTRTLSPSSPLTEDLDSSCQPPEGIATAFPTDIYSLGALFYWLLEGRPAPKMERHEAAPVVQRTIVFSPEGEFELSLTLTQLVDAMLGADPCERPTIAEVHRHLSRLQQGATSVADLADTMVVQGQPTMFSARDLPSDTMLARERLGRFRLIEKLGQGGMGAVYRAEDLVDGTQVAIKVIRSDSGHRPEAMLRFRKEARLLAEVNNPYVANLLEVNEEDGLHYLAMEFVEGQSLRQLLEQVGRLEEARALRIMADVARALVDAHEQGIVHRDIKPDNILLMARRPSPEAASAPSAAPGNGTESLVEPDPHAGDSEPRVKLTDFGLARHVEESESLHLTQTGSLLGTPLYMAPEQCTNSCAVGPYTDVYAMGATLFHLLTGRPPFLGDSHMVVIAKHCNEAPPQLKDLIPSPSGGVCQIVEKCLAKTSDARYPNAAALLHDLERVIRGEPTSIVVHPKLPDCDPSKVLHYDWTFELKASPQQLWPLVSNTERLNCAAGLPAVQFTSQPDARKGVKRYGKIRKAGVTAQWEEYPFEWIEARRMGVLREYSRGPFKWLMSILELRPRADGGTTLTHRVRIVPNGLTGRTVAALEVGVKGRKAVDRIYHRIDAALTGKLGGSALADPFEEPASLSGARRRRLDALMDRLVARGVDPAVVERLGDYLAVAPAAEVARIRPLALARRLGLDADQVVAACLHGTHEGLFVLLWDILCPVCRIPSEVKDSLKALREHGRCDACNLDYGLDFSNSVEMIFRVHPEVRETDLGTYCIGGPAHSPHVVAQVRLGPSERMELDLALAEGAYRLRGPQLPFVLDFRVQPGAMTTHWDLNLSRGPEPTLSRVLRTGRQLIALTNDHDQELVARVERTAPRDDALTAARASALGVFRELFPGEVLSPGQLVSMANVTLLVTDLEGADDLYQELGEARAFALLHEHFRLLEECIRQEGGALVKTLGEGLLASFNEPVAAVRAAVGLQALLLSQEATRGLRLRVGVHRGPAMAATLNDHLDYFGTTVKAALRLPQAARGGEVVLTAAVAADTQVAALVQSRGLKSDILRVNLPGEPGAVLHRLSLSSPGPSGPTARPHATSERTSLLHSK